MKYPLSVVKFMTPGCYKVVDAAHKVIFHIEDNDDAIKLAITMVNKANRRARWFGPPEPYSREDWLWGKDTFGVDNA